MSDMEDADRYPAERVSSILGRTPAEVARYDRVFAGLRELQVSRLKLDLALMECSGALRDFGDAWAAAEERLAIAEARQVAEHPDLAELNVTLDGYYADPDD